MYVGCHKTQNLNDDYIGSGKILKRAIKKYGIENFSKEILFIFDTPDQMFSKEAEIVDKLFVESENTYNILIGGMGGFDYVNSNGKNLYGKNGDESHGGKNLLSGNKAKKFLVEKGLWEEWKRKVSEGARQSHKKNGFHWTGRKHTDETKRKISEKMSITQKGAGNSQFGTCWIYSPELKVNKKINKDELVHYTLQGWRQGRKM